MLMSGIVLVGTLAYFSLPVAPLPTVDVATILVTAEMAGADPETNAFAVTNPLEKQFGQIAGLTGLTLASANSYAQMTLQFGFNRSVDSAAGDVQAAITSAQAYLPTQMAQPPIYRKTNPADTPVIILALTSDTLPLTTVDDYAENILLQRISQVKGVGLVTIGGATAARHAYRARPDQTCQHRSDARGCPDGHPDKGTTIPLQGSARRAPRNPSRFQANDQIAKVGDFDQVGDRVPQRLRRWHVRDVGHAEIGPAMTASSERLVQPQAGSIVPAKRAAHEREQTPSRPSMRSRSSSPGACGRRCPKGITSLVVSDRTKDHPRVGEGRSRRHPELTASLVVITMGLRVSANVWATSSRAW